jgi:CelD/BcsL family acetyltransferase involved in cellulose biosynthesis
VKAPLSIYRLNPLLEPRWAELVDRHPRASVFHTPAWLEALKRTYGYQPLAFTTSLPGAALNDGVVFCDVRSWLTGSRLVSLPFSDHCEPLVDDPDGLSAICAYIDTQRKENDWRYIELRPASNELASPAGFGPSEEYRLHLLDLRPELDALFRALHKDSTQRKVRRADREGLEYSEGCTEDFLAKFYHLLLLTRRRHHVPPQPFAWFLNVAACLGGSMKVRIASHRGRPVAAIVTLRHRDRMFYKYGASDAACHSLGGMHLLFWRTIQQARAEGCIALDLGRSDPANAGLVTFKDRWGAASSVITYRRQPLSRPGPSAMRQWMIRHAGLLFSVVPDGFWVTAGKLIYKHVG